MKNPRFGAVQMRIMRHLWTERRATARQVTDALNAAAPIAHSTVQTLLRKLEEKGAVGHEIADRTFVFFPLVEPAAATRSAAREFIDRVFAGSAGGAVAYLLKHEPIPKEEWQAIRALVEDKEGAKKR